MSAELFVINVLRENPEKINSDALACLALVYFVERKTCEDTYENRFEQVLRTKVRTPMTV